jgi:hypothetical protein
MEDQKFEFRYGQRGNPATLERLQECVDSGWNDIIARLVVDLKELGWDGGVLQVKEKFGGLRFYVNRETEAMHQRILEAENESFKTCEQCGAPGERRDGSWIKTLCEACMKVRDERTTK